MTPFILKALLLVLIGSMVFCPLWLFANIAAILIFTQGFLRVFPLNWQADVLLYGVSWVLLCHWLVASCG